ncbi:hypothetical protein PG990_010528 [Apiospora arundinis]
MYARENNILSHEPHIEFDCVNKEGSWRKVFPGRGALGSRWVIIKEDDPAPDNLKQPWPTQVSSIRLLPLRQYVTGPERRAFRRMVVA